LLNIDSCTKVMRLWNCHCHYSRSVECMQALSVQVWCLQTDYLNTTFKYIKWKIFWNFGTKWTYKVGKCYIWELYMQEILTLLLWAFWQDLEHQTFYTVNLIVRETLYITVSYYYYYCYHHDYYYYFLLLLQMMMITTTTPTTMTIRSD
jgi:hypothetical protein